MAKGHFVPRSSEVDLLRLQGKLESEWRGTSNESEPVIIEEPSGIDDYKRIYVIWSSWRKMSHRERVDVIMKAYEKTHSPEETSKVTVATGLTLEEAVARNLSYELEADPLRRLTH